MCYERIEDLSEQLDNVKNRRRCLESGLKELKREYHNCPRGSEKKILEEILTDKLKVWDIIYVENWLVWDIRRRHVKRIWDKILGHPIWNYLDSMNPNNYFPLNSDLTIDNRKS